MKPLTPLTDPENAPYAPAPLCLSCKHWIRGQRCHAFEGEIPVEITTWKFDHKKPHPLDNGLRYEPYEPKAPIGKVETIKV